MNQIVFRESDWTKLECYLSKRNDVESGVFAVFKTSISNSSNKFLVTQTVVPKDDDYLQRTSVRIAFTPEFTERAFLQCEAARGHLLDIHTHPWSKDVDFSSVDDHEAVQTKVSYMNRYLPETMIGFVVFGKSPVIARARFWDKRTEGLSPIDRIIVI
ncbi:MAG: hypothetical protein GY847_23575 [Proteobacteria bacterium]|nr:hypothetical protein [Pseudomonadota bacterium]